MHTQTAGNSELRAGIASRLHAAAGVGFVWTRRIGARRPSAEEAGLIDDAQRLLRAVNPSLPEARAVYLLDDPIPAGAARGRSVVLSRGLLETDSVAPVLAHELGHTGSLDGRLTEALDRLELWGEPAGPADPRTEAAGQPTGEQRGGLFASLIRLIARLAAGGCAARLLAPLWSAYWRGREYAADAYAASLGQGDDLARHLADIELALDFPHRRFPFDLAEHPPVALRIERLTAARRPLA